MYEGRSKSKFPYAFKPLQRNQTDSHRQHGAEGVWRKACTKFQVNGLIFAA